jgi:hypothetical protein
MNAAATAPWRQISGITVVALAILACYNLLPRRGRLTHMDFLADDATVLELCNPLNPARLPVATGSLPVTMSFSPAGAVQAGGEARVTFDLTTISGRPVTEDDLAVVDGGRIQLTIAAAASSAEKRGQVVHCTSPQPEGYRERSGPFHLVVHPGRWSFSFAPVGPGPWLITAAFTPVSTGRPLVASANLYLRNAGASP